MARALLVPRRMRNTLLFSAITTFVLCGPALADAPGKPKPTGPPAGAGPAQMLRLTLVVKAGADARTHELSISDHGCGSISDKAAAYEDQIRVCSRPAAGGLLIDTDWSSRAGPAEYRTRAELLLARTGGSGEIGRTGGHRLAVTVR
ncbi:MAG TPA: hypothetical protein VK932_26460 [Kofleriaceae bacterium]|nr:hypothetical protein [Kofleriaceae bacterium]